MPDPTPRPLTPREEADVMFFQLELESVVDVQTVIDEFAFTTAPRDIVDRFPGPGVDLNPMHE